MGVANPVLSIVILAGEQRQRASRALKSVLEQDIIEQTEVLIIDCGRESAPPILESDHPNVRVIRLSPNEPFGHARTEAVRQARAPIVAFVEEHSMALQGWAKALVRAHEGPWAAVGCEMHNDNPGIGISDVVFLIYFAPWSPPARRGQSEFLAGNNSSYKRDILMGYGDELHTLLSNELILQWRLKKNGHSLYMEPDAKLAHANETTLRSFVTAYFVWHRSFGHLRAEVFNWPVWKRALYICAFPLVVLGRFVKLIRLVAQRHSNSFAFVVRSMPIILVGHLSGAAGQVVGLLFGMGNADRRMTELETGVVRAMTE